MSHSVVVAMNRFPLVVLVPVEDLVHLVWHSRFDYFVVGETVERFSQGHWQLSNLLALFHRLVDVAVFRLPGIDVVVNAVLESLQQSRAHQIGVHH